MLASGAQRWRGPGAGRGRRQTNSEDQVVPGDRRQAQTAPGLLGLRGQEHQALDWAPKRFQPRLAATDTFPELLPRDAGRKNRHDVEAA